MTMFIAIFAALFIAAAVYFRLYLYFTPKNRLTILMYHQIKPESNDPLTVTLDSIEQQFRTIREKGYDSLFFKDLETANYRKPLIITFDDGYANNAEFLPALLEKYNLKATIFIPTQLVQNGYEEYHLMSFEQVKELNPERFEIGLHSHKHINYRYISPEEAERDIRQNIDILDRYGIPHSKVFAYPFGKMPKNVADKDALHKIFQKLDIRYAVRIGNKINPFPTEQKYELCRVDIRGNDSLFRFKMKLIFGKLKIM